MLNFAIDTKYYASLSIRFFVIRTKKEYDYSYQKLIFVHKRKKYIVRRLYNSFYEVVLSLYPTLEFEFRSVFNDVFFDNYASTGDLEQNVGISEIRSKIFFHKNIIKTSVSLSIIISDLIEPKKYEVIPNSRHISHIISNF